MVSMQCSKYSVPQGMHGRKEVHWEVLISHLILFFWIRMNGYKDNSFPTFFNMGMSLICRPESSNDCVVCTPIWKISYGRWFPWDVLSTMFPKECMAKGSSQGSAYISCGLILLTRDERI